MRKLDVILAAATLCGCASSALSQGATFPSLKAIASSGDLIVTGVGSVQDTGNKVVTTTIRVLRTVKGNTPKNDSITLNASCANNTDVGEITGLWVLKADPNGTYTSADPTNTQACHPLQSSLETESSQPSLAWAGIVQPDNDVDRLALEVAWSVHQHQGKAPFLAIINPGFLNDASKAVRLSLGRALYRSNNPDEHRIGLITLLQLGDLAALAEVRQPAGTVISTLPTSYLLNNQSLPVRFGSLKQKSADDPWIELSLSQIISEDSQVLNSLISILNSNASLSTRTGAAIALRRVHTETATNALLPYLNSDIAPLRHVAIGAVSCYVNAVPVIDPSALYGGFDLNKEGPFKTADTALHFGFSERDIKQKEDFYLSYWKAWVAAHPSAFTS